MLGHMKRALALALCSLVAVTPLSRATAGAPTKTEAASNTVIDIPFSQFKLDNGMTVIFHEDHTQPLVVTNINVQVGSRDEVDRRTGFAHLFEHLMFMGTERVPEKMFDAWMEKEGGSNNAWTSNDRTDYFDVAPSHALPLLLWMEADRLSVLGQQITKEKLDAQRDVVRNERRQTSENEPYGKAELVLPELLFPAGHPYHHPVIGSHADLEAATVSDVREFFARHYVPQNMSLVVAGDFDRAEVVPLVEKYFGSIAAGAVPGPRPGKKPFKLTEVKRATLEDNVSLAKVIMVWPSPAHLAPGDAELDLLSQVMSSGKASRLYQPLVYQRKLAQSVHAYQSSMGLESYFAIEALARPGVSLDELEQAIDEEVQKLRAVPVGLAELKRAQNSYEAGFVQRLQSLATRASMLNGYFAEKGDPGFIASDLDRYLKATADDLLNYARSTLDPQGRVILRIVPKDEPKLAEPGAKTP
jgi:predicted Zn-dependent peptidase